MRRASEAVRHLTKVFTDASVTEPKLSAQYIVAKALGYKQAWQVDQNPQKELVKEQEEHIENMMSCRLARMPIQYIMGDWEFQNLELHTRPPVFIPRPESEQLADLAVEYLKDLPKPTFMDIGSGSGCLTLSILSKVINSLAVALDQSIYACSMTLENAKKHQLDNRLKMMPCKITEAGLQKVTSDIPNPENQEKVEIIEVPKQFHLIVTNPPYIPTGMLTSLQKEIWMYEDLRALDGGIDGLTTIKNIMRHSRHWLKRSGYVIMEVHTSHPSKIQSLLQQNPHWKLKFVRKEKDFNQLDRFVILTSE